MPIYVILALTAALFFSLNAVSSKLITKYAIKSVAVYIVYYYLFNIPYLPILATLTKIQWSGEGFLPLSLFSITLFMGTLFITTVLYRYDISILHPFFHFQTIFSVGLAYLVLSERYPNSTYWWILLIIIGGILVSMNEKIRPKALISRNFVLFLIGIFFYAWSDIFAKKALVFMDVFNLKFWSSLILLLPALLLIPLTRNKQWITSRKMGAMFLSGTFVFVGTIFLYKSFTYNITISQPLAMFGSLFTLLISIVLSRIKPEFLEHASVKVYAVRTVGVVLMLLSAIMIARV